MSRNFLIQKSMKNVKVFITTLAFVGWNGNVVAQDTIQFTWQAQGVKSVVIKAMESENFTIDWGDGSVIETKTGEGDYYFFDYEYGKVTLSHTYTILATYTVTITAANINCDFIFFHSQYNHLDSLHINCPNLWFLDCSNSQLQSLDLNGCSSLWELHCSSNQLYSLDLGNCPYLLNLNCSYNQLQNLDVSDCLILSYLECQDNQLSNLDVSGCSILKWLRCDENQLVSLDFSGCTDLEFLSCYNNQLSNLNLNDCPNLEELDCGGNQLVNIDLSGIPNLLTLSCGANQLSDLDLSSIPNLERLMCNYNQLVSLDLSSTPNLLQLEFDYNQLQILDISTCPFLSYLSCRSNQLPLSDLFAASEIISNPSINFFPGTQYLSPPNVDVGIPLFAEQSIFKGIYTRYIVIDNINLSTATADDCSIIDGVITFHKKGIYWVSMTNDAISSYFLTPPIVEVVINVGNVGIVETGNYPPLRIYPNPTTGQLKIENGELKVANYTIYNIIGQTVLQGKAQNNLPINVESLASGMYYLKIAEKTVKFVKE